MRAHPSRPLPLLLLLHSVLPLLAGGLVYVIWRSESLLMFDWFQELGLTGLVLALREAGSGVTLPGWLLYTFPDGAWIYACTAAVSLIWRDTPGPARTAWLSVSVGVALLSELGQLLGWVSGTFDPLDVAVYLVAHGLALWFTRSKPEGGAAEDPSTPAGAHSTTKALRASNSSTSDMD